MDDTPEAIRLEMVETRSQLNEKLESLELNVVETLQSTGTAMTATAESVQETVETVSEAVQDAVHSVGQAFDLRRQFERHPWWVLGGAAVLGYFASGAFRSRAIVSNGVFQPASAAPESWDAVVSSGEESSTDAKPTVAFSNAESGRGGSPAQQLTDVAFGVLISVLQDIASRATPRIVDMLTGASTTPPSQVSFPTNDGRSEPNVPESAEANQRLRTASSRIARSGNSFSQAASTMNGDHQ